ncbi:HAD family hydrolase [Porphyromonas macacae]|uniref:HAD family hydrolase n=1 Tax=Porphyromonas macacae TaxID=28115 RepID=UPI0009DCF50E|nr:HAD family phosphatase [Porphyromonas macacae]
MNRKYCEYIIVFGHMEYDVMYAYFKDLFNSAGVLEDAVSEERSSRTGRLVFRISGKSKSGLRALILPILMEQSQEGYAFVLCPAISPGLFSFAFFDLDNTLISAEMMVLLFGKISSGNSMQELTRLTMSGILPFASSFIHRVHMLEGLTTDTLQAVADEMPVIPDLKDVLSVLNCPAYIVTGGFGCFARKLMSDYSFAGYLCSEPRMEDGKLKGLKEETIILPEDKAAYILKIAGSEQRLSHCVAVGDGANDMEMLSVAGSAVVYNATAQQRSKQPIRLSAILKSL